MALLMFMMLTPAYKRFCGEMRHSDLKSIALTAVLLVVVLVAFMSELI